jgi:hypothetical protein
VDRPTDAISDGTGTTPTAVSAVVAASPPVEGVEQYAAVNSTPGRQPWTVRLPTRQHRPFNVRVPGALRRGGERENDHESALDGHVGVEDHSSGSTTLQGGRACSF